MLSVCLWIFPHQLLNAWTNFYETRYVYHDTWVHLNGALHKSPPSVCVSVCVSLLLFQDNGSVRCIPVFGARQRLGKHVSAATNTRNNRRIVGRVCLRFCLCILSFLSYNSVKTFSRLRRTVGGVFFCTVRVVSKESRLLFLPRTYCLYIFLQLYDNGFLYRSQITLVLDKSLFECMSYMNRVTFW
jgi:hypothetical protein